MLLYDDEQEKMEKTHKEFKKKHSGNILVDQLVVTTFHYTLSPVLGIDDGMGHLSRFLLAYS